MRQWIVTGMLAGILGLTPGIVGAEDPSVAKSAGEAGRAIVDESKHAYEHSRDFFITTGQRISEGAQEACEEAKDIGPRMAEDLKEGFHGDAQAPDPTRDAEPETEKP